MGLEVWGFGFVGSVHGLRLWVSGLGDADDGKHDGADCGGDHDSADGGRAGGISFFYALVGPCG